MNSQTYLAQLQIAVKESYPEFKLICEKQPRIEAIRIMARKFRITPSKYGSLLRSKSK
jgi:hypothetical protein